MPDAEKWRIRGLRLVPVKEKWVYVVEFTEPWPEGQLSHMNSPFGVVVLMSGEAVEAIVSPWKAASQRHAPDAPSTCLS
jgi:hypothetical protein